jgi:hypothetical protein
MYRVNLYPEAAEHRRSTQRRLGRTLLVSILVGLEAVLLLLLGLSGILLREQAKNLQAEVDRLSTRAARAAQPDPLVEVARDLLAGRVSRVDWSPKLAALPGAIGPSLVLTEITAQMGEKGRPTRFELAGTVRPGASEMEPVTLFVESLRNERSLADDFPVIKLGTLEGGGSSRFQIHCEAAPSGPKP